MSPTTEQLWSEARVDPTPRSAHVRNPSWSSGILSPKLWTEDTPPTSDESSYLSSRTSFSEHSAVALEESTSQDDEPISYAVVEPNESKFGYRKIKSRHIPKGWSNDPRQLESINGSSFRGYNLDPPTLPVLASDTATTPRRYLVSNFGKFYFWIPSTYELLYVTKCYNLEGILQRINDKYELQTKSLEPLALQYNQHQIIRLPLWFWQIPHGWAQDLRELEDLREMVSGQEYGLPLPIPILVSDGSSGSSDFLMKCGEDFYLFNEVSHQLLHIDEPSKLRDILCILGANEELNVTPVNYLPKYGGPNVVTDDNVPSGWSNKIGKEVSCADLFYKHRILGSDILLFWDGRPNDPPKYLVEAASSHYIWDTISNDIWRIDKAQGLQDILDVLKDPTRHLSLSRVSTVCRPKTAQRFTGEGGLVI